MDIKLIPPMMVIQVRKYYVIKLGFKARIGQRENRKKEDFPHHSPISFSVSFIFSLPTAFRRFQLEPVDKLLSYLAIYTAVMYFVFSFCAARFDG